MDNILSFDVAEVLSYDKTYQYDTEQNFAIYVRSCNTYFNKDPYIAIPANNNVKKIPRVGELVLVFKSFNNQGAADKWRGYQYYYLSNIDVQTAINDNRLPSISQFSNNNLDTEQTRDSKIVSPLQPYEGDLLFEGRFGNTIRLGSSITNDSSKYSKMPSWTGANADPLIILSNNLNNLSNKEFVVENPNTDASSLYLTSTQTVQLDLNKQLTEKFKTPNGSQFIGIADRISLSAKQDIAIIHSNRAIVLQTPGEVLIGGADATQPIPHGHVLENILQNIICAIQAGCTDSAGGIAVTNGLNDLLEAQRLLNTELNSKQYKIKFT
jgi:hypothetical protein